MKYLIGVSIISFVLVTFGVLANPTHQIKKMVNNNIPGKYCARVSVDPSIKEKVDLVTAIKLSGKGKTVSFASKYQLASAHSKVSCIDVNKIKRNGIDSVAIGVQAATHHAVVRCNIFAKGEEIVPGDHEIVIAKASNGYSCRLVA